LMYQCAHTGCTRTFAHPEDEDNCEALRGYCAHLMRAGWRPVWVKTETGKKGGWVCREHAKEVERMVRRNRRGCWSNKQVRMI